MVVSSFRRINRLLWLGIALMVLGAIAILAPYVAGWAVVSIIGLTLLVAGIGLLFHAYWAEGGFATVATSMLGMIALISAVFVLVNPNQDLRFLTLLLLVYFVADGCWKIFTAFRYMSSPGWLWLLASGGLALLLGFIIWRQWPVSGLWGAGMLIGINLLSTGVALIALARSLKGLVREVIAGAHGTRI